MIEWVHDDCKDWGDYIRRTPRCWPSKSTEYRLWRERGADRGKAGENGPEWDWPDSVLEIHRAFRVMPVHLHDVMVGYYVKRGAPDKKARSLGLSKTRMYELRDHCHYFIAGRMVSEKDSGILTSA